MLWLLCTLAIAFGELQLVQHATIPKQMFMSCLQCFSKFLQLRLQQHLPCEPIREQNLNPFAIWLDGTVLALATGCCKNLGKRCTMEGEELHHKVLAFRVSAKHSERL